MKRSRRTERDGQGSGPPNLRAPTCLRRGLHLQWNAQCDNAQHQSPREAEPLGTLSLAVGTVPLLDALDFLELLAETNVDKLPSAALRCHGRFELEATTLMIAESRPHCPRSARCAPVIAKPSMCSGGCRVGCSQR